MIETGITTDMLIVFALLGLAIFLFITELLRVDIVGLLMMVLLPLTGVITPNEALAGLSSNAVVSIIAVMIIGAGLNKTGVMNMVAAQIIKFAGRSETRIMVIVASTVAIISSFMQNIGAAALFLPATMRISKQLNLSPSRILMPMGFCAITGGCLTLVGSSPLIMLNDLMASWWKNNNTAALPNEAFSPLGLLSVTPVGISLLVAILLYFVVFGKKVLPGDICNIDEGCMDKRLQEIYGTEVGESYEVFIPFGTLPQTLEALQIRPRFHITVIGIAKQTGHQKNLSPMKDDLIEPGDSLWVMGTIKNLHIIEDELGWQLKPEHIIFNTENSADESGVIEGVVIPHSNLTGHSMEELQFRRLYQVNPLAIVRGDQLIMEEINVTTLIQGDTILLQGKWQQFHLLKKKIEIVFIEDILGENLKPERIRCAVFFLLLSLVMALGFGVKLSIALLTGALGMIITKIIPADRAYEAVDWRTVFLLSGLIPLGTAFENTGAASFIATQTLQLTGVSAPIFFLLIIAVLTSFFSLVVSNVGATVLMVPLAMNMAQQLGANPITAAVVVALSASNTFILPTHQVNALIMRPGGYRTKDYMKAGIGASLVYLTVLIASMVIFFP